MEKIWIAVAFGSVGPEVNVDWEGADGKKN